MRDFKKLLIWQQGMIIVDNVYDIIPYLPDEEKFGMRSQMTSSATEIPVNIAEARRIYGLLRFRSVLRFSWRHIY